MAELFDTQTKERIDVPDADAPNAILSGRYGLDGTRDVVLFDPDGKSWTMPASSAIEAFKQGYTYGPQTEAASKVNEDRFGAFGAKLLAGGAAAARGLTLGLSDRAMRNLGAEAGTLRDLEEGEPLTSTALEVGGGIASVALTGGASGIGKAAVGAAKMTGKGLMARAGAKALELGVAGGIEGAAFGAGKAITEDALGRADLNAESLIANAGLGALIGVGVGGVLGGGGVLAAEGGRAVLSGARSVSKKVAEGGSKLYAKAVGLAGGDEKAVADAIAEPFTPQGMAIRERLFADPESRDLIAKNMQDSINKVLSVTGDMTRKASGGARGTETKKLLEGVAADSAEEGAYGLADQARELLSELKNEPDIYSAKGAIRQFEKIVEGYEKRLVDGGRGSASDVFSLVDDLKRTVDDQVGKFGKNITSSEQATIDKLRGFRSTVKGHLEDATMYGESGARQQSYNSALSEFLTAQKEFFRKFGEKVPTKGGGFKMQLSPVKVNTLLNQIGAQRGVAREAAIDNFLQAGEALIGQADTTFKTAGVAFDAKAAQDAVAGVASQKRAAAEALEQISKLRALDNGLAFLELAKGGGLGQVVAPALGTIASPSTAAKTLYRIERAAAGISKRVDAAMQSFVGRAGRAAEPAAAAAGAVARSAPVASVTYLENVSFMPKSAAAKAPTDRRDAAKQRAREIAELANDPQKMADRIAMSLTGVDESAPGISGQAAITATKAVQHLAAKAPKNAKSVNTLQPLIDDWRPTDQEVAEFERHVRAAMEPLSVLSDLENGTLTPEAAETFRELYPQLHQMTFAKLTEKLSGMKDKLPYADRVNLSLLFGAPVDDSMRPDFISRTQAMWAQKPQANNGRSAGNPGNLDMASNMRSMTQRLEEKR